MELAIPLLQNIIEFRKKAGGCFPDSDCSPVPLCNIAKSNITLHCGARRSRRTKIFPPRLKELQSCEVGGLASADEKLSSSMLFGSVCQS